MGLSVLVLIASSYLYSSTDVIRSETSLEKPNIKIAFTSVRDGNEDIYLMNLDGTGEIRLTSFSARDSQPSLSPDGSKVAFVSDSGGWSQIYIVNADGSGLKQLTMHVGGCMAPVFSPDGKTIAFTSVKKTDPTIAALLSDVYIMDADGKNKRQLTALQGFSYPMAFSPDGKHLLFYSSEHGPNPMCKIDTKGAEEVQVLAERCSSAQYSPDGSRIVFQSGRALERSDDIYVMNADGTGIKRLTTNGAHDPSFTPDGKLIVFTKWHDGNFGIGIMNADGTNEKMITSSKYRSTSPSLPLSSS